MGIALTHGRATGMRAMLVPCMRAGGTKEKTLRGGIAQGSRLGGEKNY